MRTIPLQLKQVINFRTADPRKRGGSGRQGSVIAVDDVRDTGARGTLRIAERNDVGCSPWSVWDLRYQPWRFGHLPAAIILLSILAFSGCGRARPSDAELAGTYVPDAETRTIATRDAKGSQPTVVLKADGTCTLSDMPGWWLFADPPDPPWSGTGTWRFEENGDGHGWQVFIHVSRCSSGLNILGSQPPYALGTWVDDPDTGQFVRFVKREYADSPARRDQAMH